MNLLIEQILRETDYPNNRYFTELLNGNFTKDDFIETQIQFFFAVVFFNRPMAALAAKIPTANLRLEILRNVWEEHGEGNFSQTHENTFLELLKRLGAITKADIDKRMLWPEVRIFNTCLTGTCVMDDYMVGTAMMGIIERMFCDIASIIGRAIVERKWLNEEQMIHYNLHEKLDIKHSQDFFDVLSVSWGENQENKYYIEQGLRLGATLFNNLYTGLYERRQKRYERQYFGSHSRS